MTLRQVLKQDRVRGPLLLFIGVVIAVVLAGASNWLGQDRLAQSQREGCERGKLDRKENARGWRTAQAAREATLAKDLRIAPIQVDALVLLEPAPDDPPDLIAARNYNEIAAGLEARSRIDCVARFPGYRFP